MAVAELHKSREAERAFGVALDDYAGQWVGIQDHKVVANTASLEELVEQLQAKKIKPVEVFRVPEESGSACFF